jgi:CubicO group peptidase (beta-lactamase class C family)
MTSTRRSILGLMGAAPLAASGHLLTHTSGLGDHMQMPGFWETAATWTSPEQVMDGTTAIIRQEQLAFPPGAGKQYSNSGYHLLGAIVAQASGQSYYDYVRERIFAAAGMSGTDFYTKPQRLADQRIARPYVKLPSGERVDDIDHTLFIGTPAGDAYATAADMDRFAQALLGEKLLSPAFHPHHPQRKGADGPADGGAGITATAGRHAPAAAGHLPVLRPHRRAHQQPVDARPRRRQPRRVDVHRHVPRQRLGRGGPEQLRHGHGATHRGYGAQTHRRHAIEELLRAR